MCYGIEIGSGHIVQTKACERVWSDAQSFKEHHKHF